MNRTNIEWAKNPDGSQGYTWNPITGCLNGCDYCYARKLANGRLRKRYLDGILPPGTDDIENQIDPFYPRFWEERLGEIKRGYHYTDWGGACEFGAAPKGIFVCDMGDLFGIGIPEEWTRKVLEAISQDTTDRFYLLTKQPQELIKWSPFPPNCFVGVTATDTSKAWIASKQLSGIEAKVKFLSIEPLLSWKTSTPYTTENIVAGLNSSLSLLIIGACTGTLNEMQALRLRYPELSVKLLGGNKWTAQSPIEWLREIVEAADKAGVKVFLKDNLEPSIRWPQDGPWAFKEASNMLRQEMPE